MPRIYTLISLCLFGNLASAQIQLNQLQFRAGYAFHHSLSTRFNTLIDEFNNERYPLEISQNLSSIHFQHGLAAGINYAFREDMTIFAVYKQRAQNIKTQYISPDWYRHYRFSNSSLELGISFLVEEKGKFSHSVGGGITFNVLNARTAWQQQAAAPKVKDMFNISHAGTLGISLSYEAKYTLNSSLQLFARPVIQYALPGYIRNLDAFMNPVIQEGELRYISTSNKKFNKGSLNGMGIELGILISPFK